MALTTKDLDKAVDRLAAGIKCVKDAVDATESATTDNRHEEVVDEGTTTIQNVANYSYSVISGSATVTINGVTLTGVPAGFDARQGDSKPGALLNDITITGESVGTRIIIYYELA